MADCPSDSLVYLDIILMDTNYLIKIQPIYVSQHTFVDTALVLQVLGHGIATVYLIYLLMQRSEEEMQLLKDDMYATLTYWLERIECIAKAIKEISFSADRFSRGATCSLQQLKWEAELHLSTAIEAFGSLITIPTVVMEKYKSDFVSEDSSDSDSSCDSSSDSDSDLEDVSF